MNTQTTNQQTEQEKFIKKAREMIKEEREKINPNFDKIEKYHLAIEKVEKGTIREGQKINETGNSNILDLAEIQENTRETIANIRNICEEIEEELNKKEIRINRIRRRFNLISSICLSESNAIVEEVLEYMEFKTRRENIDK